MILSDPDTLEFIKFTLKSLRRSHCSEYLNGVFTRRESSLQKLNMDIVEYNIPRKGSLMLSTSVRRRGAQLLIHLLRSGLLPEILSSCRERVYKPFISKFRCVVIT